MTTIYIVRHGETNWNLEGRFQGIEDIELNNTGRQQALNCTSYLKNFDCNVIVSSPLLRAKETAEIIARELGISNVEIMNELKEKDFGSASGLLWKEIDKTFPNGIPDAEPKEYTTTRSMEALKIIDEKYNNKNVIVVTHGGIINTIFNFINDCKNTERLKNTSITIIKGSKYDWNIELFNYSQW